MATQLVFFRKMLKYKIQNNKLPEIMTNFNTPVDFFNGPFIRAVKFSFVFMKCFSMQMFGKLLKLSVSVMPFGREISVKLFFFKIL